MEESRKRPISTGNRVATMPFAGSSVDIIIPYHGAYHYVRELVDSIYRNTKNNKYQICLVDDCSPNTDFGKSMSQLPRVKIIRNEQQVGFSASLFAGYSKTNNPWVVFLNSDCLIDDGFWLLHMGETLLKFKNQNVKMVSAKIEDPTCGHPAVKWQKDQFEDIILEEGFLPLHCVLCHRELFPRIKGFLKPYPYGFYEDEELAYRMNKFDFRQAVSGKSHVTHFGGLTVKQLWKDNPETKKTMTEDNRKICLKDMMLA